MDWANNAFGKGKAAESSRLILQVDNPMSAELDNFIQDKGYEVSSGRLIGGQFGILLNILVGVLATIGFLLLLLSVLIFILNFQLIISRASEEIKLLLQLGYKTKQISQVLTRNVLMLYGTVILAVLVVLFMSRIFMVNWMETQGFQLSVNLAAITYLLILAFSGLFLFINFRNIERNVKELF